MTRTHELGVIPRSAAIAIATLLACARPAVDAPEPVPPTETPAEPVPIAEAPAVEHAPPPADAEPIGDIRPVESPRMADPIVRAREHFARGLQAFEVGDHSRALTEFIAADQLVPKAVLRFDIARCRSAMGDLHGARMELQALLARGDLDEAMRKQANAELAAIERKLAGR